MLYHYAEDTTVPALGRATSGWGQKAKNSLRSAVGTVIADRPPPKSVQAEFPHTAPTLGA
jgi:hypothetical protein